MVRVIATAWYLVPPNAEMRTRIFEDARARGMTHIEFRDIANPLEVVEEVELCPPR
jgi:hypothetical protein